MPICSGCGGYYVREPCPICDSAREKIIPEVDQREVVDEPASFDLFKCSSCGDELSLEDQAREDESQLCSFCTLDGITEPNFRIVVYRKAISSLKGKKNIQELRDALQTAHTFVSQQPYWQN
ncbi:MAG: hypothetical protein ACFFD4_22945, partial [Candidatus Odinarchaeota archaeon]